MTSKYRRKIFNDGVMEYLRVKMLEIRKRYAAVEVLTANHDRDHVHIMISIPPKMSVGSVVRIIKSNTARELKEKFEHIRKAYWGTESVWSGGYFVSTVGMNEEVIRKYVELQGQEDSGQAKLDLG